jgi:hypothetical protein
MGVGRLCCAGEAEFIDWASPNMTMHAQKMGNALEIAAHLQTCIKKGLFLAASGLLTRCLRYLWRIVHASPPDAKVLSVRSALGAHPCSACVLALLLKRLCVLQHEWQLCRESIRAETVTAWPRRHWLEGISCPTRQQSCGSA